jgi:hypothetical protein
MQVKTCDANTTKFTSCASRWDALIRTTISLHKQKINRPPTGLESVITVPFRLIRPVMRHRAFGLARILAHVTRHNDFGCM